MAPALSPQLLKTELMELKMVGILAYIVTFDGSPPNAETYFCTHLNARRSWRYMNEWFESVYYQLTILKAKIAYFRVPGFLPW